MKISLGFLLLLGLAAPLLAQNDMTEEEAMVKKKVNEKQQTVNLMQSIALALETFKVDDQGYPFDIRDGDFYPFYLKEPLFTDAWGLPFEYFSAGRKELSYIVVAKSYVLRSRGPDKTIDTADDIVVKDKIIVKGPKEFLKKNILELQFPQPVREAMTVSPDKK